MQTHNRSAEVIQIHSKSSLDLKGPVTLDGQVAVAYIVLFFLPLEKSP